MTNSGVESYTVNLFSAHSATLPALAFEGATRRNRPNLAIGALVYARVVSAPMWSEPEITCIDAVTGKAEGMGELKIDADQGFTMVWPVSLALAQSLNRPKHTLLQRIAAHFPFEAAVGVNGLVWTRAATAPQSVVLGQLLEAADRAVKRGTPPDAAEADDADAQTRSLNERIDARGELSKRDIGEYVKSLQ